MRRLITTVAVLSALAGANVGTAYGGSADDLKTVIKETVAAELAAASVPSSAVQTVTNDAAAAATNNATTSQTLSVAQNVGGGSCHTGCGGGGGHQDVSQKSATIQPAKAKAVAEQEAVNASVPVTIGTGGVSSGPSSASQHASNDAAAASRNTSATTQNARVRQDVGGGGCKAGCGGGGGFQNVDQGSLTLQAAKAKALADQEAVNANVPVTIGTGRVSSGPSSASQRASNDAAAMARNDASTSQTADVAQRVGGGGGCLAGCGGDGGFQSVDQGSLTLQAAKAKALADQDAVNANVPVTIGTGDVSSGPSSATQNASNDAAAASRNTSTTTQTAGVDQQVGGRSGCDLRCVPERDEWKDRKFPEDPKKPRDPKDGKDCRDSCGGGCAAGCGGGGGFQKVGQTAFTIQPAWSKALANQNAVNADTGRIVGPRPADRKKEEYPKHGDYEPYSPYGRDD